MAIYVRSELVDCHGQLDIVSRDYSLVEKTLLEHSIYLNVHYLLLTERRQVPLVDELPGRFHVQGLLRQIEQTFRLPEPECGPGIIVPPVTPPVTPPGGGGVIITTRRRDTADLIVDYESFDVQQGEVGAPRFSGRPGPTSRVVGGSPSQIGGVLRGPGEVVVLNPAGLQWSAMMLMVTATPPPPSLEELNIRAPDGATVTLDEDGVLTVESSGDIHLEGPLPEIPGLTGLQVISTGGSIFVTEVFRLTPGIDLSLDSRGGDEDPPGDVISPPPIAICGLRPVWPPEETLLGRFSLIASSADLPIGIDVLPWSRRNRLRLGSRQLVSVAVYGSASLDVLDVDHGSLRLGPAAAPPLERRGSAAGMRLDLNRDGHRDLLAFFRLSELGVAYGDETLCLSGEARDGTTLDGCDAIDTRPRRPRPPRWQSLVERFRGQGD